MALDFSTETRQAATVFTEYRNTIDIFTEDCDKDKEFYVKLLKRLMEDTDIIINDIYPLGCRQTVIDCCKNDTDSRRKKLYIVDGDIYLQYKEKENIAHLYVLDSYCIENFLICEDSICDVAYRLYGCDSYNNVKTALNIPKELNDIAEPLIRLFFYYSIQMECTSHFHRMSIDAYMDKKNKKIDKDIINRKIIEIRNGLTHNGIPECRIDELLTNRQSVFPNNEQTLLKIVSGKDFVIPYFKHHIKKQLHCKIELSKEAWKFNLVDKCDIEKLASLKQAILSA